MKPLKQITPMFFVTGDVGPQDLLTLASQGYKTVINNRPDGEEPGQALHKEIAAEAKVQKLVYMHIPVVSGQITEKNIEAFAEVLEALPAPVVAFCRSGTRSATLWALSQAGNLSADEILKATAAAGYDLSGLKAELEKRKVA